MHSGLESDAVGSDQIRKQITRLEGLLAQKATERSRVVGLYQRVRSTGADLDAQMDEIGKEQTALESQIAELGGRIAEADPIAGNISSPIAQLPGRDWRAADPGANHLAGDHDFHAPILLPSAGGVIGSHRIALSEALRRD